jgi:predicted nuclease of predicted toxin-antitoxin system
MHDLGPAWKDREIWAYASQQALVIVSKDADSLARALLRSDGPKVVHVRVGNLLISELYRQLQ